MRIQFFVLLYFYMSISIYSQYENVRVNDPKFDHWYINRVNEVSIAIDPNTPNNIAAGSNISLYYFSNDGGKTWLTKEMESLYNVWGDPVVIYDNSSNLLFSHLSNPVSGYFIDRIVVQKSEDNGTTWNGGVGVGYRNPKQQDKEWLAVDRTDSPFRDNLYMAWTEFDSYGSTNPEHKSRILFSHSNGDGINWSDAIVISDVEGNCIDEDKTTEGAVPAVGPNGEVYIAWAAPEGIVFDKSLDGGKTFGEDVFISDQPGGWAYDIPGIRRCNGLPITACDISDSQYRGTIYVNWTDQRNGVDDTDVFLAKSTDGGNTWSEVKRVNTDNTKRQQFFTWMTIDQSNGNLYFLFYDRRNTTEAYTDVYLARSKDGGETFENFKINENTFLPKASIFFGDYIGIDVYNGMIHPIWGEMNNDVMSIWTATIKDSDLITNVKEQNNFPSSIKLFQNYPNPFNPATTIGFSVPQSSFVSIKIYDALGKKVETLVEEVKSEGVYEINFDANDLTSGTYYYRLNSGNYTESRKMVLIK